jgi:hypothetical protein
MTKNDIQIGFNSEDEVYNYLNKNQDMDYKSIDASKLFLLLQANQNKYILLYKLKIEGNLEFDKLEFLESFWFEDCQITGDVEMQNAIFNGAVSLKDLSYKDFKFSNTTCENTVVVSDKMSGEVLSFGDFTKPSTAKFKGGVRITECDLDSTVFFGSWDSSSIIKFTSVISIQESNIKNCLFEFLEAELSIYNSKFNVFAVFGSTIDRLFFGNNTFGQGTIFAGGRLQRQYFLGFTTIKGPFMMYDCSFLSDINFYNAVFNEVVNFTGIFSTNLNLNNSRFEKGLNLGKSEFKGGLNLGTSEFKGGLNLGTSQFGALLDFNDCRICKFLNWKDACYAGSLGDGIIHHNVNFPDDKVDRPVAPYPLCK